MMIIPKDTKEYMNESSY